MINKLVINYLNRHKMELFNGKKVTCYNIVCWANMTTMEIYSHSIDSEILGTINGKKIAIINNNYEIIATEGR